MIKLFKKKQTISPNLIAILIIGIVIGFFAGLVASGGFYETGPPVFAISDGEKTTYLELYEGEKATVNFLTGESMSVGNVDGVNFFVDSGERGISSITEEELSKEEAENLVGEAWIIPWRWIPWPRPRLKPSCTDSDGGLNYYLQGTVERGAIKRTDFCLAGGKRLREYYCKGTHISSEIYDCSKEGKVCEDGACVMGCAKEGELFSKVYKDKYSENCCEGLTEWSSGMDTRISVEDTCYETGLLAGAPVGTCINCGNQICEDIENPCNCPNDCIGQGKSMYKTADEFCKKGYEKYCTGAGAIYLSLCKLCDCTDSDGGKDYYVKGTTKGIIGGTNDLNIGEKVYHVGEYVELEDTCNDLNPNNLYEFYCESNRVIKKVMVTEKTCPNGCKDGVCLFDAELTISTMKDVYSVGKRVDLTDPPTAKTEGITGMVTAQSPSIDNQTKEQSTAIPETKGYIIQFKEKPMLKKRAEIRRWLRPRVLREHRTRILEEHRGFKRDVPILLGKPIDRIKILGEYTNVFNGIALNISKEEAEKLKQSIHVKEVYPNRKLRTMLMDSAPLIDADDVWKMQDSKERKITGEGTTIAIIDTGIDYTHPDLGSCNPVSIDGNIENYSLESPHPYTNRYDNTWTITKPGFTKIGAHFTKIDVEYYWDKIYILDANDSIVQTLTGTFTDLWSNSVDGNTIKIRLVSDYSITDWGFAIDKVINGTVEFNLSICDKVVGGYDFVNDDEDPMDDHGHGTHCAGIVASNGALKGVAPDAKLYAYKVLSGGGWGYLSWIVSGIERAVDPNNDGDFSDHVDVISMSLGAYCWGGYSPYCGPDDPLSQIVDNAVEYAGVVVVVAAGNAGPANQTIASPGTARKAITVGATYKKDYSGNYWGDVDPRQDQITSFSSRGPVTCRICINKTIPKPDVVAPGAIICASRYDELFPEGSHPYYYPCFDNKHVQLAGTSMATPHVAGAVALIKQAYPDFTPEEIKMKLKNTAKDIGYDINTQGYGRIDVLKAVLKSQILNREKANIHGFLTMKVEKHDGANWVEYKKVVNKLRKTVPRESHLALDTIWKEHGSFTPTESGNYRVYAEFTDEKGNIIRTKTGWLKNSWEFRVV